MSSLSCTICGERFVNSVYAAKHQCHGPQQDKLVKLLWQAVEIVEYGVHEENPAKFWDNYPIVKARKLLGHPIISKWLKLHTPVEGESSDLAR